MGGATPDVATFCDARRLVWWGDFTVTSYAWGCKFYSSFWADVMSDMIACSPNPGDNRNDDRCRAMGEAHVLARRFELRTASDSERFWGNKNDSNSW